MNDLKFLINNKMQYNNKSKNNYTNYKEIQTIKYFIIFILSCNFYFIYPLLNLELNKIHKIISFFSYEITLKVKGTGNKNILSPTRPYYYQCPSEIYLNNELVDMRNLDYCYKIRINEQNSEIRLVWKNIKIESTMRMFYNCNEITKINMTKFDTSLVTNMYEMFAYCSSLNSLIGSNFNTTRVKTFENMFYQCTSLTSINLESFTNPSATSLANMFYGCKNLEYINIKNFEEKKNINLNNMFYNIPPNAIICLSSCPPPTNFIISEMNIITKEATISWEGYEWNNFIISYGLKNLDNPENGNKINVTNTRNYTFTNLSPDKRYDIYIKTNCGSKSSYWLGPLLISIESYNMPYTGSSSINTCSKVIYDSGGPNRNYENNAYSTLKIFPSTSDKLIYITGIVNTERNFDFLYIYRGAPSSNTLLGEYSGFINIPLLVVAENWFTLRFISDSINVYPGFQLTIGCIIYSPQTIYGLIKDKKCQKISCDINWKNIQNVSVSCVKNCRLTSNKYQYRGKCYSNCPEGTTNIKNFCYLNNLLESCEKYTIESELENACTKCKNNYYTIFGENSNNFIHCYKNNSLEKYYLDNNDLLFKPCYKACKTCDQSGTIENSNCLSCDSPYYPKYEDILKNETYINCYQKIEGYSLYNNQYFVKYCFKTCDICLKKGNSTHHNCKKCKSEYPYELLISSQFNCYKKCELKNYFLILMIIMLIISKN